ncbi:cupin [Halobacteriales archaeon QS_1_68_20]|nr:MAG: cupin [Halobacteriales archaeon QS_1_68_20]
MRRVSIDDVESTSLGRGVDRRDLAGPLGATDVAVNRYRLPPGERFSSGLHAHPDQEELFVVLSGEATFETWTPAEGDQTGHEDASPAGEADEVVGRAGEAVRFAPGEYQSGANSGDDDLVALAIGAPRDGADVRVPLACPACGHVDRRATLVEGTPALVCPDCGDESEAVCGECGSSDLRARIREGRPVSVCADCGAVSEG